MENKMTLSEKRKINKKFRAADESHLYPINGRFNATNRAIRRASVFERQNGPMTPLEYEYFLEHEISRIVNSQ